MTRQTASDAVQTALAGFDADGFAVIDGAVSQTSANEILDQIHGVLGEALASTGEGIGRSLDETYLALKEKAPALKSHCYNVLGHLDSVARASASDEVRSFGRRLLGRAMVLEAVQIRIADPSNDRFYPLHQELGLFSHRNFTAWTPLVPLDGDAGGLAVVKGSHRLGILPHRHLAEFNGYHGVEQREDWSTVAVTPSVGQTVLFHPHLVHGSLPNRSSRVIWVLIARYNDISEAPYLHDAAASRSIPRPAEA